MIKGKGSTPEIEARNNQIVEWWNTTDWPASKIADELKPKVTRETVCGVLFRIKKATPERITRPAAGRVQRLGAKRAQNQARVSRRGAIKPQPALVIPLEESRAMAEAVLSLRPRQCRFPLECEPFAYCPAEQEPDTEYCAAHHKKMRRR